MGSSFCLLILYILEYDTYRSIVKRYAAILFRLILFYKSLYINSHGISNLD